MTPKHLGHISRHLYLALLLAGGVTSTCVAQTSVAVEGGVDGAATVTRVIPLPDLAVRDYPATTEWLPIRVEMPICVSWSEDSPTETCVLVLPDAPHPHSPSPQKKGFWRTNWIEMASAGALVGGTWADIHTTESVWRRCPRCTENGLLYHGGRPSAGQLWAADGVLDLGISIGEHYLARWARRGTKAWPLAFGTSWIWTAFHIHGAVHNARLP